MLAARPKNATKGANSSVVPDPTADQDDLPEKEPEPEAPKGPGDVTIGAYPWQPSSPCDEHARVTDWIRSPALLTGPSP